MRVGMFTASRISELLAGGSGKTKQSYIYDIACEVVGVKKEISTAPMIHGINTEQSAFDFGVLPADAPQATTNSIIKFTSDSIFVSSTVSQTTDPIVEKGVLYSTSPTPTSNSQKIVSTESTNSFISIISL